MTVVVTHEVTKMMPAQLAALLLPLLPAYAGQSDPSLSLGYAESRIEFHVEVPGAAFVGGVLLSFNPHLRHYLQGLPPLLADSAVLGIGIASPEGELVLGIAEQVVPPGIPIHAQGVVLLEEGLAATDVESFIVDGSAPGA